jgi:hypothetical protein
MKVFPARKVNDRRSWKMLKGLTKLHQRNAWRLRSPSAGVLIWRGDFVAERAGGVRGPIWIA